MSSFVCESISKTDGKARQIKFTIDQLDEEKKVIKVFDRVSITVSGKEGDAMVGMISKAVEKAIREQIR